MNCPSCRQEMEAGRVLGNQWPLIWLPETKHLLLGIWARGGKRVGERTIFRRPAAKGYRCTRCGTVILPGGSPT